MKLKRPIVVVGDVAIVPLTQGKSAIIDSRDVSLVEGRDWYALRSQHLWYAASHREPPRGRIVRMHRLIVQPPDGMDTDHINHDGLDNRRKNLRVCTRSQNMANGRYEKVSSSQFRGVCWHKTNSNWRAGIFKDGKRMYLGVFDNEIEAAEAYDEAALKMYGEFATLNFPGGEHHDDGNRNDDRCGVSSGRGDSGGAGQDGRKPVEWARVLGAATRYTCAATRVDARSC